MGRLSLKGVILGGITDVVATNVLSFPVILFMTVSLGLAHVPQTQIGAAVAVAMRQGPLGALLIFIGCACSVLGGYVAARIAKHDELLNGAVSAWLCVALGFAGFFLQQGTSHALQIVASELGAPLLGLFGGYLSLAQRRRLAARSTAT